MGAGFCVIAPALRDALDAIHAVMRRHGVESFEIGHVIEDSRRRVYIPRKGLVGEGDRFQRIS